MKCPACNSLLKEFLVKNVALDACNTGCGGIWFDNRELKKFDEAHEPLVDLNFNVRGGKLNTQPYACPKCSGIKLFKRFSSVKRKVEVDECAGCGGIWLDQGEIAAIRAEFKTETDRTAAADEMFGEMLSSYISEIRNNRKK